MSQDTFPSKSDPIGNVATLTDFTTVAVEKPLLDVKTETQTLLGKLGSNHVEPVAYDTAWLARLMPFDKHLATKAIEWLRANQLPDGRWGANQPLYHHDRVICTLAAIISLARYGAAEDLPRIQKALPPLQHSLANLDLDISGRTIAFEMLLPTLVAEARSLGLPISDPNDLLRKMYRMRVAKLERAPKGMISRGTTLGFSAEMVGTDGLHLLDIDNLQLPDGSLSASPAATAFYASYVRPEPAVMKYLRQFAGDGGAPAITAIDVFERAWGVWNFSHAGAIDERSLVTVDPLLNALESTWRPGYGIPPASSFSVQDGDDTGLVYEVLSKFGRTPDIEAILRYEEDEYFRCYDLESDASISTNIHILGALRQIGLKAMHPTVQKVATFLRHERNIRDFWQDKWHASPYYPTSHAIIVCAGYLNHLVEGAVEWLLATQNRNGSWGFYVPTAEETAYCLQALLTWYQHGLDVPRQVLERGVRWLIAHASPAYPPLWIGKCLYCPTLVVQSAIVGALRHYEGEFGNLPA